MSPQFLENNIKHNLSNEALLDVSGLDYHYQGIVNGSEARNGTKSLKMQCFPLFSILLALGSPIVDFLSLDIEVFRDWRGTKRMSLAF